jgi:hypothetical protein
VLESRHLRYSDLTDIVSLKSHDGGDDMRIGHVENVELCPDEYWAEWKWILREVRDAVRFAEGCRAAADGAWRDRFDSRGW